MLDQLKKLKKAKKEKNLPFFRIIKKMKQNMKNYLDECFKDEIEINRMMRKISKDKMMSILAKIVRK